MPSMHGVGASDGAFVGDEEGDSVGEVVGPDVGDVVGRRLGVDVTGSCVGDEVGACVGCSIQYRWTPHGLTPFHRVEIEPTPPSLSPARISTRVGTETSGELKVSLTEPSSSSPL